MKKIAVWLAAALALAACQNNASNQQTQGSASPGATTSTETSESPGGDWSVPAGNASGNRTTALTQITPDNVAQLKKAWVTAVADDGEEEANPIETSDTVYVTTSHDSVLAMSAIDGKLKWAFTYNPQYELQYPVNRGIGLDNGKAYIFTQDCRLVAIDQSTGKMVFNVPACHDTTNTWYSSAAYIYNHQIIVGTSGGDLGSRGLISAFDENDGHRIWDWSTIARPPDPNANTWPGNSWQHGGASAWAGLSVGADPNMIYAAPGNPEPNLTTYGHVGKNLYSDSVVALDISGPKPVLKWYYQIMQGDTHDADPAMPPVIFNGNVNGGPRSLLAVGDKAGDFLILDRTTGKPVYRMAVSNQENILTTHPTVAGTVACPNHGGGVEWNGGAYSAQTNYFYIPSTNECATWKIIYAKEVPYIPGQPYQAGPLPKRRVATGLLTAVDVNTGRVAWKFPMPYSGQGGALTTSNGLVFTSDLRGRVYALDAKSGKELWHDDTGASVVAPLAAYQASDGNEYIVVMAGEAGNQHTPNLPNPGQSRMVAYRLNVTQTAQNDSSGQTVPVVARASSGNATESGAAASMAGKGTAPYTLQQVAQGQSLYQAHCATCHGAGLQGVSAPALDGPALARSHLNVSQMYDIVRLQMPLSAPGSLSPDNYAAIMAFLLKHECVPRTAGNRPFPSTNVPALSETTVGGQICP